MRRALLVGINHYPAAPLSGCIHDATAMEVVLSRHANGDPNFTCKKIVSSEKEVTRSLLRSQIEELFATPADVALLYFSGHGTENSLGGYLVTQDAERYDEGLSMDAIVNLANASKVKEVVVILDCCHSGALGNFQSAGDRAVLREGVSLLAASRSSQASMEVGGKGVFTSLICDALYGGAADVLGQVTVASIYAYVDQIFGAWDQRPLFKAHVSQLFSLRKCDPVVPLEVLRQLPRHFQSGDAEIALDPSFEPTLSPKHDGNEAIFGDLQKYRGARLLEPVGEEHMYYAAANGASCRLTPLGKFYWHLANSGKL